MAKQSDNNRMTTSQDGMQGDIPTDQESSPDLLELRQIYALIDSILPFEACLYYQVAPLSLDGSCLIMGIVDPDDEAAIEYVTRQLSYINYSIRFQTIGSDWHRELLSQYLKHSAQPAPQPPSSTPEEARALPAESAATSPSPPSVAAEASAAPAPPPSAAISDAQHSVPDSASTPQAPPKATPAVDRTAASTPSPLTFEPPSGGDDDQLQATFILDQIEELTATMPREFTSQFVEQESQDAVTLDIADDEPSSLAAAPSPPVQAAPPAAGEDKSAHPAFENPFPVFEEPLEDAASAPPPAASAPPPAASAPPPTPQPAPPPPPEPQPAPVEETNHDEIGRLLCALPPKVVMQALLDKVIGDGIGRLYFKREGALNRILWSRNGVLEGLIEPVESQVLQAVINEFKQLTHMALMPVAQPQQVEIERTHNGQRVLLRLQIMPSKVGEQATLQVLRGAALQFHQQQQMDRLERDALDAAQMLQKRLNAIRDRARDSLDKQSARSETLPTLVKLLKQLEAQVQEIEAAYETDE